jgi:DNA modification methylase
VLEELEPESVHCCVCSPPYFGLRDYGHGDQIGLEETPEQYIAQLVQVFRAVRRTLRKDGTLWVVIGDSYVSTARGNKPDKPSTSTLTNPERQEIIKRRPIGSRQDTPRPLGRNSQRAGRSSAGHQLANERVIPGLKPKDLIGIPWMLAFALRADGWWLRRDIIWHKPNPMPESCRDRPTSAHEYLFLLSKSESYFYDHEAIKEPTTTNENRPPGIVRDRELGYDSKEAVVRKRPSVKRGEFNGKSESLPGRNAFRAVVDNRNKRSVWSVATQPYPGAHYAVYPPKLIEPCILAGTSPQVCEFCGAPWKRILGDPIPGVGRGSGNLERKYRCDHGGLFDDPHRRNQAHAIPWSPSERPTIGWQRSCRCEASTGSARAVVLDPFNGAGTTGLVCHRTGRDYIGIEINPDYAEQARRRIHDDVPLFSGGVMGDEFARTPRETPAKTKTDSTAPLIDPKLEPTVKDGQGVHDKPTAPVPSSPEPGMPDPRSV